MSSRPTDAAPAQAIDAPAAPRPPVLRHLAAARLPTRFGDFTMHSYQLQGEALEHIAVVKGDVAADTPEQGALLRIHSECLTGDIFGSLRCDCGEQLALALQRIEAEGRGVLIYMRGHEGRGIGITAKLRAYALQDQGLDTVEANEALGLPVDSRRFDAAAAILHHLGARAVRLMSNNPLKLLALQQLGISTLREAHEVAATAESGAYLATKRDRMGHWLDGQG